MEQSELLRDALRKAGVTVEFEIPHGAGHGGPAFTCKRLRNPSSQSNDSET